MYLAGVIQLSGEGTGHSVTVTVVPGGFLWEQQVYESLSTIARRITGTSWNGPRFFGLRDGAGRDPVLERPGQSRAAAIPKGPEELVFTVPAEQPR